MPNSIKFLNNTFVNALLLTVILSFSACEEEEKEKIQETPLKTSTAFHENRPDLNDLLSFLPEPEPEIEIEPLPIPEPFVIFAEAPQESNAEIIEMKEIYIPSPCGCTPNYRDPEPILVEEATIEEPESILPEVIYTDPYIFETKAYPNPTNSFSTVELDIDRDDQFEISLYSISGQLIETIYNGELVSGRQQFEVDLSYLPDGLYFVQIMASTQHETLKIQKMN